MTPLSQSKSYSRNEIIKRWDKNRLLPQSNQSPVSIINYLLEVYQ